MFAELHIPEKADGALWSRIVHEGRREALAIIERNFEQNPDHYPVYLSNLPYHGGLHALRAERRTASILDTARFANPTLLTTKDVALGRINALFHDTVQVWEEKDGRRKRSTGYNERESAEIAVGFLSRVNLRYHRELFTPDDKKLTRDTINATKPGFKDGTVIQPLLTPSSHIITKGVDMSDVNGCLIDGPAVFIPEGDALFREDNIDILVALREKGVSNLTAEQIKEFRDRMFEYLTCQMRFVEGREAWLESDLDGIPKPAKSAVRGLFTKGDASKTALREAIAVRKNLQFGHLVREFGYIL